MTSTPTPTAPLAFPATISGNYREAMRTILGATPIADHPTYDYLIPPYPFHRCRLSISEGCLRRRRVEWQIYMYGYYAADSYRVLYAFNTSRGKELAWTYRKVISVKILREFEWSPFLRIFLFHDEKSIIREKINGTPDGKKEGMNAAETEEALRYYLSVPAMHESGMRMDIFYLLADRLERLDGDALNRVIDDHRGRLMRYENWHVSDRYGRGEKFTVRKWWMMPHVGMRGA